MSLHLYLIFVAGQDPPQMSPGTYWRPGFFDCLKEEYQACREGVALMDMSSFAKFQITVRITFSLLRNLHFLCLALKLDLLFQSPNEEALEFLQRLCSNDVNIPVGHICPSGMLNERGGYENDCMLLRQANNW